MSTSGVNPFGISTEDLAWLRQATRPMWRGDAPLTLDEATEGMRLAGATVEGVELTASVLIDKLRFVIDKRVSHTRQIAERGTIFRTTVGSKVHGLNLAGQDDRDEMGVCVEPSEYVIGLRNFEQHVERSRPEGERSQPGDLDLVVYSLRKWVRLALSGNPTVLLLLFAPESEWIKPFHVESARSLQALAPSIVSKRAGHAFLGYMEAQRKRLLGEVGQKNVKRPELEDRYGFDVKYAMHVLRLGFQGCELLTEGRLSLPMVPAEREYLRAVRTGHVAVDEVVARAGELEERLRGLIEASSVRAEPDRETVDKWLVAMYQEWWD